jgi:cytochrome c
LPQSIEFDVRQSCLVNVIFKENNMRNFLKAVSLMMVIVMSGLAYGAERATPDEAMAMVQKTIAAMKANGVEKTIAEINSLSQQFRDRDLYISVMDMKGFLIAHGANKRMQGIDIIDLKDIDGKVYIRQRLDVLKTKDRGWQDYKFVNPVTKQIEQKTMYFQKYGDVVISCGAYKPIQ